MSNTTTILVIEDELEQRAAICKLLERADLNIECLVAESFEEFDQMLQASHIDVFLFDIDLRGFGGFEKDGIELGEYVRGKAEYSTTPILFLTGDSNYIFRAVHETNCFDYIIKPYQPQELVQAIQKMIERGLIVQRPLEVRCIDGVYARIAPKDICFVQVSYHQLKIVTVNNYYLTTMWTLGEMKKLLPANFIKVHRSFFVNLDMVINYDRLNHCLQLEKGTPRMIPVGRKYKEEIEEKIGYKRDSH